MGKVFPCTSCGARLEFAPGTTHLHCPYCGHTTPIPQSMEEIRELDFATYAAQALATQETLEAQSARCTSCGAVYTGEGHSSASHCPFCGAPMVVEAMPHRTLKPAALLPFKITAQEASERFKQWLKRLWFAPGSLQSLASVSEGLRGVYLPFWTFDAQTTTFYQGLRGDDYVVTETYRTRDTQGRWVVRTRNVVKTRWTPASGVVWNPFDDVLVAATTSVPPDLLHRLEPWDLSHLVPYREEYLSGFGAEAYQVGLEEGFREATRIMEASIRASVCRDIGGDRQVILSMKTQHDHVTFKHVLLPVWISAYRYRNRVYRFLVNARTGEVQGQWPVSALRVALFVLALAGIAALVVWLMR